MQEFWLPRRSGSKDVCCTRLLEAASEDAPLMLIQEAKDLLHDVNFKLIDMYAASTRIQALPPPPCIVRTSGKRVSASVPSSSCGKACCLDLLRRTLSTDRSCIREQERYRIA